jgi:hypothetical protein
MKLFFKLTFVCFFIGLFGLVKKQQKSKEVGVTDVIVKLISGEVLYPSKIAPVMKPVL